MGPSVEPGQRHGGFDPPGLPCLRPPPSTSIGTMTPSRRLGMFRDGTDYPVPSLPFPFSPYGREFLIFAGVVTVVANPRRPIICHSVDA